LSKLEFDDNIQINAMCPQSQSSKLPETGVHSGGSTSQPEAGESFEVQPGLTGPKILVVDDDVPLGKFLSRELKRRHFSVEIRQDGEAARDDIRKSTYDLVILDLNLPKMDGMAVLKQVRVSHPRLPILVLTARNHTHDLVSALEQGADDCLIKPFSFLELLARVRRALRRSAI
jgi:CheY-like chemotaxis protein